MATRQTEENLIPLWEMHSSFVCPVAGFCFSDFEIKKMLKTPGNQRGAAMDTYGLHQAIMAKIGEKNRTAEKADRFLRNKYAKAVDRFGAMDEATFKKAWTKAVLTDDMPALFYVAALRNDLSPDFLVMVYGDVHMAGYRAMTAMAASFRSRDAAIEKTDTLTALLAREKHRNGDFVDENIRLKAAVAKKTVAPTPEPVDPPGGKDPGDRIETLERRLACRDKEIRRLERERRKAEIRMFESTSKGDQLEQELNQLIAGFARVQASTLCTKEACPNFDACSKRILIVGGLTKLKELYRKIVESKGGIFDYHSGRIRNGKNNLEARVKRSDLVICPVNHNSHNACIKVKQFCNKHNKDIHMIPGSSLAAISTVFTASGLETTQEQCPVN
ncbi:MAG: DUF2325 domain-containing protein [Desulfobacterium sp.]|nr:DUF2325 domain-containing protein [Desulfobacterium sp.]